MSDTLLEIAARVSGFTHGSTKPPDYYQVYETYLADLRDRDGLNLLEVGVHSGESLKVFSEYFARGKIVGIDLIDRGTDFSDFPNVAFLQADQTDRADLTRIAREHAPDGFDVIIDDASHFGAFSLVTYRTLFPHLKPGGLYVIEDWGTGYIEDWHDGGPHTPLPDEDWSVDSLPRRLPSHDFGMVGFVKSLVDEVWAESIKPSITTPEGPPGGLTDMHFHRGIVVLRKR